MFQNKPKYLADFLSYYELNYLKAPRDWVVLWHIRNHAQTIRTTLFPPHIQNTKFLSPFFIQLMFHVFHLILFFKHLPLLAPMSEREMYHKGKKS